MRYTARYIHIDEICLEQRQIKYKSQFSANNFGDCQVSRQNLKKRVAVGGVKAGVLRRVFNTRGKQ